MTNLDWIIDAGRIAQATGAERVAILNDMQAMGHSLAHIKRENLQQIVPGPDAPQDATRLVVNVGTGLNAAPVYRWGCQGTDVTQAEQGHMQGSRDRGGR